MIQNVTPKGSIIYKLLIVILAAGLVATIIYPKTLWEKEDENTRECRNNMEHILNVELIFIGEKSTYEDTLDNVIELILQDTTGNLLRRYSNIDSVLASQIIDFLGNKDSLASVIIDSLQRFGYQMDIDTTEAMILDSLRTFSDYSRIIDSMATHTLKNVNLCPTIVKPYDIIVVDTSQIKYLTIACPIDSVDSLRINSDFIKHTIGGLTISSHGTIEQLEKSWQE